MTKYSSYILGFFKQGAALQTLFRVPQTPILAGRCPAWSHQPPLELCSLRLSKNPFFISFEPLAKGRL